MKVELKIVLTTIILASVISFVVWTSLFLLNVSVDPMKSFILSAVLSAVLFHVLYNIVTQYYMKKHYNHELVQEP